jgi:LPXTG-motif cell wall-anchored protein
VIIYEEGFVRMSMVLGAAAMLTLCSLEASAQFTGVVVPPKAKPAPAADSAVTRTIAETRDSVTQVHLGNMKDWVDSAASTLGVVPAAPAATDTAAIRAPAAQVPAQQPAAPARGTTEFREGATAPNTATPIPLLALLGLSSLVAGLWLVRRRRA